MATANPDPDDSAFKFIKVGKNIELESVSYDGTKRRKLEVEGGIYKDTPKVRGNPTTHWKEIVSAQIEGFQYFLTLDALRERLKEKDRRQEDFDALKKDRNENPFELWNPKGSLARVPTSLVLSPSRRSGKYDKDLDEKQLQQWEKLANNLIGKPSEHVNPTYARFSLRPSDALKTKGGDKLLYCTPANPPVHGITEDKLKDIIADNKDKLDGWPKPFVTSFQAAKNTAGLRLVGRNFLQLYFVWMMEDYYKELWKDFQVSDLLHALPAEGDKATYKEVDEKTLEKGKRAGPTVDGVPLAVTGDGGGGRIRQPTQRVMGESATKVAEKLWGMQSKTSGMGNSKVEWLHRVAFALGGMDAFRNLVFGTWECNTDMIRAENLITELTKNDDKKKDYQGRLTTTNRVSGKLSRFNLQGYTDETIPTWTKDYSWLCFSLKYRFEMDANNCPLGQAINHEIDFDPWSLYVPLSIEPRLDTYLLKDLKPGNKSKPFVSSMANPQHGADAYATVAWDAAINRLPSVELADLVVRNPTIVMLPSSVSQSSISAGALIPEGGFVLRGEVDLFGTTVVGKLEKWIGPSPEGVVIGIAPPSMERVVIPGDFHMSTLIPLLQGTPFDQIIFRNVAFYHQSDVFDRTKSIGWHFNADWVIDPSCGLLHDILRTVLQVDEPNLSIHAAFGELEWRTPLNLQGFLLEGVFPNLTLSPVSGLTLTTIGVRLLGIRGFSLVPEPHSTLSFGFAVFGTMKLDVPGSVVPLDLAYETGLVGSAVNLRAELSGPIWEDALGVEGLLLEDVTFGTSFSTASPWKTFALDVSATFSYLRSRAYFQGSYSAGGHFSLVAEVDNFGMDEIEGLFYAICSNFLTLPDFDVQIGSAIISIVSGQGLSVSLRDVQVAGYTVASAALTLSPSGVTLSGTLSSSTITFGDVELRRAALNLSFWAVGQKKNVDLMLGGTLGVDFLHVDLTAVVHLYPDENGVGWAVVAELSAPGKPFSISDVVPAVKGSFVDFSLRDVVLIAASNDDPLVSKSFPKYQVRKGIHVFGAIERIQALDYLLRQEMKGLLFNAGWSKASGFSLFVSLPVESSINLGHGIKTTPITVGIRTSPLELSIKAGVKIPVKDSDTPLDFSLVLAANELNARASAQMEGWWVKPFGIDNLKIGPEVVLSIGIVYAQFVTTGTPSEFGIAGGLMIGKTKAYLAMSITEDPRRLFLYGKVKYLDISDVVAFAETLLQQNIPKIPKGLLELEELQVYICPSGVVLGNTAYPPGFSFKADLLLFDKRADIECTIDKAQKSVNMIGGVDNFELGPLTVRGSKGPRASLECAIGVSKQRLAIDGVVSIFDVMAQTNINIQFLPDPTFKFHFILDFAKLFEFKVDAELIGSIYAQISYADFKLYAEFDVDILGQIEKLIAEQFGAAKSAAKKGVDAAKEKCDEADKEYKDGVKAAEKVLEEARKIWKSYEEIIRRLNQPVVDRYGTETSRLERGIRTASQERERALRAAEHALNAARSARAAALRSAADALDKAIRDMEDSISRAEQRHASALLELQLEFGNVLREIERLEGVVRSIQGDIDALEKEIYEDEKLWFLPWKLLEITAHEIELLGMYDAKGRANRDLNAARDVLNSTAYIAKARAVAGAREAVLLAEVVGSAAVKEAEDAIRRVDASSQAAVKVAEDAWMRVLKGTTVEEAKQDLELFKKNNDAAYNAAMGKINGLKSSNEYIAFNTAKASFKVAEGSTGVLDAANEALNLVKNDLQVATSIFNSILDVGLNVKTVILSGTLRGIIPSRGGQAQPFLAEVKGTAFFVPFDIKVKFDPRDPMGFIRGIFEQLWESAKSIFAVARPQPGPGTTPTVPPGRPPHPPFPKLPGTIPAPFPNPIGGPREPFPRPRPRPRPFPRPGPFPEMDLAAGINLLQQPSQADVYSKIAEEAERLSVHIPRAPFSGEPIVSSSVVARMALRLMEESDGM